MRKPIMIANWKMNKTRDEALQFIFAVNQELPNKNLVDAVICAPTIILRDLVKRKGDTLHIGAQNMHFKMSGAYTGETSPLMLKSTGVEYVIIGHSERREMFNETDETVNLKLKAAIENQILPILCVGEKYDQRMNGEANAFISNQLKLAFEGIAKEDAANIIVAYEPIWAIGTGASATAEIAEETCKMIRETIKSLYDEQTSSIVRILYGGSVKPSNVKEYMEQSDIDGALVGGASLDPASYIKLCEACK